MKTQEELDAHYAKQAFSLMETHKVSPTPEHYAVWFHYAQGKNAALVKEIEMMVQNALPFSPQSLDYLYHKYVRHDPAQKSADEAAGGAQKVLAEVLKMVGDFSGETKNYNQDVDQFLGKISEDVSGDNVKQVVKGLIEATAGLKKRGEQMTQKLEDSTKEITKLKKNLEQATAESQRDFLTGIYNRKTFERLFDENAAIAKEKNTELCLMMIDIDHFKQFNDKFGHLLGDEVLKIVARTLTDTLKGRDVVGRFGGEEFIVFLPETPIDGALRVAEIVRKTIAGKELKRKDTGQIFGTIAVSIGVGRFRPLTDTLPSLIKRADDALYEAKHQGRNRVVKEA